MRTTPRHAADSTCEARRLRSLPGEEPPQYGGSGWSGARSGPSPSKVLGGPAAASGGVCRSQPRSGQGPEVWRGATRRSQAVENSEDITYPVDTVLVIETESY